MQGVQGPYSAIALYRSALDVALHFEMVDDVTNAGALEFQESCQLSLREAGAAEDVGKCAPLRAA